MRTQKQRFYGVWKSMRQRCYLKTCKSYHRYGGRGISVCERWQTFKNFEGDMLPTFKPGLQIDRINNDGNYEPSNCRWVTPKEQAQNRLQSQPKPNSYQQISYKLGGAHSLVSGRLKKGWKLEDALTIPVKREKRYLYK